MAQPRRNRKSSIPDEDADTEPLGHYAVALCFPLVVLALKMKTDTCCRRIVSVELRLIRSPDPHPTRTFILKSPTYAIRIGRGSKSGNRELFPASYNAWFDSRVMSREHAVLKADPDTRSVYIEDVGSMHGTFVENKRIRPHERYLLHHDHLVRFGNEVTRGPESFPPLYVVVRYSWVDDSLAFSRSESQSETFCAEISQNTFQAPECDDGDEEEEEEDDDISFVQETVLKPKLEVVVPSVTGGDHDSSQSYNGEAISAAAGQAMVHSRHSSSRPPPSPISLSRSNESMAASSSPPIYMPKTHSGLSGLTDPERQTEKRTMHLVEKPAPSGTSRFKDSPNSLPTSPASKAVVEQPEARVMEFGPHQTTTQPAGLKAQIITIDEDLTQSESDPDEAYSPNLMVDDSDEGQMRDVPTDYGSDPDEEALLIAEKPGTKMVRVEDSTDSESSHSDSSNDIGLDRDEDFFDHTESKTSNQKDPSLSGVFNCCGKETTEQEPVPYNMRPGNFTMPCSRLSLPSNPLNRAPSPSDAAMAKSCDFAASSSAVLGSTYPYNNTQPWVTHMAPTYGTAWPPHASYDCGFQYPYGATYASEQITSGPFRTFHSPMSMVPDQGFMSDQSGTRQPDRSIVSDGLQSQSQPQPISATNDSQDSSVEVGRLSPETLQPGAKLSIESIIERLPNESTPSSPGNQLKRKADDMTIDALSGTAEQTPKQILQAESSLASTRSPQKKVVTAVQVKTMQNMASASVGEMEHPSKRARTEKNIQNTSLSTLAATALAGAVVGGVSVVAALVALPPDFFV